MSFPSSTAPTSKVRARTRVCVGGARGWELVIEGHAQVALPRWWWRSQRRQGWRRRDGGPTVAAGG